MKYRKERRTGVLDVTEQLLERDSLGIFYKNGGMMNGREVFNRASPQVQLVLLTLLFNFNVILK